MRRLLPALLLALAARGAHAQEATAVAAAAPTTTPPAAPAALAAPASRSFQADWHMGRARDLRHAGRLDAALVELDSVLMADRNARGVHTMRALVLAEKHDQAGTLAALRQAHEAGDTLAFAAAMQVGTDQYRAASLTKRTTDYAQALATLQLADSLAPTAERRATPRLLVAATALALANGELTTPGVAPSCQGVETARGHTRLALANLEGTAGAPAAQVAQVRGALVAFSAYTELQARQLRCA